MRCYLWWSLLLCGLVCCVNGNAVSPSRKRIAPQSGEPPFQLDIKVVGMFARGDSGTIVHAIWGSTQCCQAAIDCQTPELLNCDVSGSSGITIPSSRWWPLMPQIRVLGEEDANARADDTELVNFNLWRPQSRQIPAMLNGKNPPDINFDNIRFRMCKSNPLFAKNARVKFRGATDFIEFRWPQCEFSNSVTDVTLRSGNAVSSILYYDLAQSVVPRTEALAADLNAVCDTKQCFKIPSLEPRVWSKGDTFQYEGKVCEDINLNGLCADPGDLPISGAKVYIGTADATQILAETTSNTEGVYTFSAFSAELEALDEFSTAVIVPASDFAVPLRRGSTRTRIAQLDPDAEYSPLLYQPVGIGGFYANALADARAFVQFQLPEVNPDTSRADIGFVRQIELGRYIWFDEDRNGLFDDVGLENVVVELRDQFDTLMGTTATDATGAYVFRSFPYRLTPGTEYRLIVNMDQPALNAIGVPLTATVPGASMTDTDATDSRCVIDTESTKKRLLVEVVVPAFYPLPPEDSINGERVWVNANFGVTGFDCSTLGDCNGHGICISTGQCDFVIGFGGGGANSCNVATNETMVPTPPPTFSNVFLGTTNAPKLTPGDRCGDRGGKIVDFCGVCGGTNTTCEIPGLMVDEMDATAIVVASVIGLLVCVTVLVAMFVLQRRRTQQARKDKKKAKKKAKASAAVAAKTPLNQYARIPDGPNPHEFGGVVASESPYEVGSYSYSQQNSQSNVQSRSQYGSTSQYAQVPDGSAGSSTPFYTPYGSHLTSRTNSQYGSTNMYQKF